MTETRRCKYTPCAKEFVPTDSRHEYCEPTCRANQHYLDHPEKGRSVPGAAQPGSVPADPLQSVATHPLDEAREVQALQKDKRMWRLAIEVQIGETLLATGYFHADDLDPLGIPAQHCQLAGTRTGAVRSEGLMEKTGVERARANPASNYRKAAIYRITAKGRRELAKWIDERKGELAGSDADVPPGGIGPSRALARGSVGSGEDFPEIAPQAPPASGESEPAQLPGLDLAPTAYDRLKDVA